MKTRRSRGAPRRLLLESAKDLFAKQDYRSTTTREIADRAGVLEHLLFRNFGSKAALFREAVVTPFVELGKRFDEQIQTLSSDATGDEIGAQFIGSLYDLLLANRGLVSTLIVADSLPADERADMGLGEISSALTILGRLGADGIDRLDLHSARPDLAARSSVAMVMGIAAFGSTLFGSRRPSRKVIVEGLTQMTLHGFLHRS